MDWRSIQSLLTIYVIYSEGANMAIENWILYKRYGTSYLIYLLIGNVLFWAGAISLCMAYLGISVKELSLTPFFIGASMLFVSLVCELYLKHKAGIQLTL